MFKANRPFNPFSINTTKSALEDAISKMKAKKMSEGSPLALAVDFKKSLLEFRYGEIVKTDDIE